MLTVTVMVTLIMIPRIYGSWLQIMESAEAGDIDKLVDLQAQQNNWIIRHFICALLALALVIAMEYCPDLGAPEQIIGATEGYCAISFVLALIESVLAQKISSLSINLMQPVKEQSNRNQL
jgi:hypothetical protein